MCQPQPQPQPQPQLSRRARATAGWEMRQGGAQDRQGGAQASPAGTSGVPGVGRCVSVSCVYVVGVSKQPPLLYVEERP